MTGAKQGDQYGYRYQRQSRHHRHGLHPLGERWDRGRKELMVEAFEECLADSGIAPDDISGRLAGHLHG